MNPSWTKKAIYEYYTLLRDAEPLVRGNARDRAQAEVLRDRARGIAKTGISSQETLEAVIEGLSEEVNAYWRVNPLEYEKRFADYLIHGNEAPLQKLFKDAKSRMVGGREVRDLLAGQQVVSWTAGPSGGYLISQTYENRVFESMSQVSPLLSDAVTDYVVESSAALQPKRVSGWDLSTIKAAQIGESVQQTAQAVPTIYGNVLQGNRIFKISLAASIEAAGISGDDGDVPSWLSKFFRAVGVGLAREIGGQILQGAGGSQILGLLSSVPSSGVTQQTPGKLSLTDLTSMFFATNRFYRAAPKCAWLLDDYSYKLVRNATDNQGRPLLSVEKDEEILLGKKVYVCPDADAGFSNQSVGLNHAIIFGDLSSVHVRCSKPSVQRVLNSGISDITQGECLFVARLRADSVYFDPSQGSAPPLTMTVIQ